jgi:predicted dehydrogenase
MPLRLGIIGAGHLGKFHAKIAAQNPEIQLVAIADPNLPAAKQLAEETNTHALSDFRVMLPELDAAIIAAPTCLHFGIGQELLRRGIHTLIEKPLAVSVVEADQLVTLARRNQVVLQVGHIERFNPGFTAIRTASRGARLIQASRYSGYSFRSTDIGVVLDLMVHDLDLAMQIAGCGVQSVEAMGMSVFGPHEDLAHARLTFDNGCVALIQASRVSDIAQRQMEVWTETSRVRVNFTDRTATVAKTDAEILSGERNVQGLSPAEVNQLKPLVFEELIHLKQIEAPANNPLADEQQDFLEAIREGRDPQVTGEHGRDVIAVAERILAKIQSQNALSFENPAILRGPHWATETSTQPKRKSA